MDDATLTRNTLDFIVGDGVPGLIPAAVVGDRDVARLIRNVRRGKKVSMYLMEKAILNAIANIVEESGVISYEGMRFTVQNDFDDKSILKYDISADFTLKFPGLDIPDMPQNLILRSNNEGSRIRRASPLWSSCLMGD